MKADPKNIIVSPSGQFYGSENVLYDFLSGSERKYKIYAPALSLFLKKLEENKFDANGFKNLKALYFQIFVNLLFQRKNLILNEAGHIKYVKVLAKLLPFRKFILIIRLLEDCNTHLNNLPHNIELIAVSNFIKDNVVSKRPVHVIYDPYAVAEIKSYKKNKKGDRIPVGIIGRLTESKGLDNFIELIKYLSPSQKDSYRFLFYGTYDSNNSWFLKFKTVLDGDHRLSYELMGFESKQEKLFNSCYLILHFNKNEALGRILFEAIDYNLPFLCFRQGGTGELAVALGLKQFTYKSVSEIAIKLDEIKNTENEFAIQKAKTIIKEKFTPKNYAQQIEKFL